MTVEEQRYLFTTLTPEEFMDYCIIHTEKLGYSPPICSFIKICLDEELGKTLSSKEVSIKRQLQDKFSDLDISRYKQASAFRNDPSSTDIIKILKDCYLGVSEGVKNANNPNKGIDHSGLIELLKGLTESLDFSKKDRINKGPKYNSNRFKELLTATDSFKGKIYQLDSIKIKLTTRQFIHILIGHLEHYKIPRKGKMIQFNDISDWKELLLFIDNVIDLIKIDLNTHFTNYNKEYNNTDIIIGNNRYGIHIGKNGDIRTLYQLPNV